jgi:hypothetical protein
VYFSIELAYCLNLPLNIYYLLGFTYKNHTEEPTMALPGDYKSYTNCENKQCDECENIASYLFCTEADSMGAEWIALCSIHFKEHRDAPPIVDTCDWCGANDVEVVPMRDQEEGHNGPVYEVCAPCRKAHIKQMSELYNDEY